MPNETLIGQSTNAARIVATRKLSIFNRLWGFAATVLSVTYTVILAVPAATLALFRRGHPATYVMHLWSWLILRTCGVRFEIEGMENLDDLESFVLVSNHKSMFDIMAIIDLIPREMRFVAKRELRKIPVVGFAIERCGNIVIDRESGGREIRRALEVVRDGYSICVFAEGRRFNDDIVHPFSEGAAWLGIVSKLPCVPMAIRGTSALMPRGAKFVSPGHWVKIAIGRPIETKGMRSADRIELTRRLEMEVRAAFRAEV